MALHCAAYYIVSDKDLEQCCQETATMLRKAAGVFQWLVDRGIPRIQNRFTNNSDRWGCVMTRLCACTLPDSRLQLSLQTAQAGHGGSAPGTEAVCAALSKHRPVCVVRVPWRC